MIAASIAGSFLERWQDKTTNFAIIG